MASVITIRPVSNSFFSDKLGVNTPFIKSWEMDDDIASSKPAAVDSAAAKPPAATNAITQLGKLAIAGLASTIMSLSTFTISLLALYAEY